MTPRTGRPKSENPKTVEVKARIDVETNEELIKFCKKYNLTRTDVVRKGIKCVLDKENKK